MGSNPTDGGSARVNVSMSEELKQSLEEIADKNGLSNSAQVRYWIRNGMQREAAFNNED